MSTRRVSPLSMDVGMSVLKARKARGMTVRELAEKAGMTTTAIINLERGTCSPTLAKLKAVADALDMRLTIYFERTDRNASV